MAKKKLPVFKKVNPLDWENVEGGTDQWESLSTGFAPLWKPEKGDAIIVMPTAIHTFKSKKVKKGQKKKDAGKINFALEAIFKGGSNAHFYTGSGSNSKEAEVSPGSIVAIGTSYNLMGEDKLAVEIAPGEARLSKLSQLIEEEGQAFKIVFNGKIPLGGGRSVNDFSCFAPKGFKERLAQKSKK